MFRLALICMIGLLAVAVDVAVTWAQAVPRVQEIVAAHSYRPALEAGGDRALVVVHYHIDYDEEELPAESIDEQYVLQVKAIGGSDDGEVIVAAQPYPFNRRGYGHGLLGILTPSTDTTSFQVALLSSGTGALTPVSGQSVTATERSRNSLEADVRNLVRYIDAAWGNDVSLLEQSGGLTQAGEAYIDAAIPYAVQLLPSLHVHTVQPVEVTVRSPDDSYQQELLDQGDEGDARWNTQFDAMAAWFGQTTGMVTTIVMLVIAVVAAMFFSKLGGSGLTSLGDITLVLLGGAAIGWVGIAVVALMGFAGLLTLMWILVLKRVE